MNPKVLQLLLMFTMLFANFIYGDSISRNYSYQGDPIYDDQDYDEYEDDYGYTYLYNSDSLCIDCFIVASSYSELTFLSKINGKELNLSSIPNLRNSSCDNPYCKNEVFYTGYLHYRYKKGFPFLIRQIKYSEKYPKYNAYWPETSSMALKISNEAFRLFENLIESTQLLKVKTNKQLYRRFIVDSWYFNHTKSLHIALCAACFRFSDYYRVCKDLRTFSNSYFAENDAAIISDKIDHILDVLGGFFAEMYRESLLLHPTEEILQELAYLNCLYGGSIDFFYKKVDHFELDAMRNSFHFSLEKESFSQTDPLRNFVVQKESLETTQPDWFKVDYFLMSGTTFNELMLHESAVEVLSKAIIINPNLTEAYIERAHAYFELDKIDLALQDYNKAKDLILNKYPFIKNKISEFYWNPIADPKTTLDYSGGFCIGIFNGGCDSIVDFVPSTFSCCRGILHGLWSFACSPIQVSKEVIDASYELIQYFRIHTSLECLETVVPEIKTLCLTWDSLSEYDRGKQVGYIIGKYGVDILTPGAVIGGIKKARYLRRVNTMYTLECCTLSQTNKAKILERSSKHASIRTVTCEASKKGRVIPRNANVASHVMQKKHSWNKLLNLSGDKSKDFKLVVDVLEKNKILTNGKRELLGTFFVDDKKINRYLYRIKVQNIGIEAEFMEHTNEGLLFLHNAWIDTR